MKKSKYQQYIHCFISCILGPYAFWFSFQQNIVTILISTVLRGAPLIIGEAYQREALISMWIPKGATLIRGNTVYNSSTAKIKPGWKQLQKISSKFCILQPSEKAKITERKQYLTYDDHKVIIFLKTSWQNEINVSPIMKQNQRPKLSFRCALSYFMATYYNSLCRYRQLWSLFVSPQLKNRFIKSKRLYQQIKHRFVVRILF